MSNYQKAAHTAPLKQTNVYDMIFVKSIIRPQFWELTYFTQKSFKLQKGVPHVQLCTVYLKLRFAINGADKMSIEKKI